MNNLSARILGAIVFPLISAHKAGIALSVNDLEGHYLAGGNVQRVVNAFWSRLSPVL